MSSLNTSLTFKGDIDTISDLPETANLGDVWRVSRTDSIYVYVGTEWVCMSTSDAQPPGQGDPVAQICTQCNGTLELDKSGRLYCPYCGTIYR